MSSTSAPVAFGGDSVCRLVAAPESFDVESVPAPVSVPVDGAAAFGACIVNCCGVINCVDVAAAAAGAGAVAP
jgi:hypothetical protein